MNIDVKRLANELGNQSEPNANDSDYAIGIAFEDVGNWTPQMLSLSTCITLAQNRFLFNSADGGKRGYINVRLTKTEFTTLREAANAECQFSKPCYLYDVFKKKPDSGVAICDASPEIRALVDGALDLFGVPRTLSTSIVAFDLDPKYATSFWVAKAFGSSLMGACLIGDAAMSHHFWPGRGLNTGLRAADGLSRAIVAVALSHAAVARSPVPNDALKKEFQTTLRKQQEIFNHFMDSTCKEEIIKRSGVMFGLKRPKLPGYIDDPNAPERQIAEDVQYTKACKDFMIKHIKGWRDRMEQAGKAWPHARLTDEQIEKRFDGAASPMPFVMKVMMDSASENGDGFPCGWKLPGKVSEVLPYTHWWEVPAPGLGQANMKQAMQDRENRTQEIECTVKAMEQMAMAKETAGRRMKTLQKEQQYTDVTDVADFYDFVVEIDMFKDVLEGGWKVLKGETGNTCEDSSMLTRNIRFVIVGNFKRGKTWLLQKISDADFPSSETTHTPGLCFKTLEIQSKEVMLIDTKGENTPLNVVSSERLNDKKAEESFLRDIVSQLAEVFIYLVNSIGYNEQLTLMQLQEQLRGKNTSIFVIHNLKHLTTRHEFEQAWNEIKKIYADQNFVSDKGQIDGVTGEVRYLERQMTESENSQVRVRILHFVLGHEDSEAGMDNEKTIKYIKNQLALTTVPVSRKRSLANELASVMTDIMPKYLNTSNTDPVQVCLTGEHGSRCYQLQAADTVKPTVRELDLGTFISIQNQRASPFSWYQVLETLDGEKLQVEIDLCGYTKEQADKDLKRESTVDNSLKVVFVEQMVQVAGIKIHVRPRLIKRPVPQGWRSFEGGFDASKAPELDPIVIHKKMKPDSYEFQNGALVMKFVIETQPFGF